MSYVGNIWGTSVIGNTAAGKGFEVNNSGGPATLNLSVDNQTTVIDSQNRLATKIDGQTLQVVSDHIKVIPSTLIDANTLQLNSNNTIKVNPTAIVDNTSLIIDSNSKIKVNPLIIPPFETPVPLNLNIPSSLSSTNDDVYLRGIRLVGSGGEANRQGISFYPGTFRDLPGAWISSREDNDNLCDLLFATAINSGAPQNHLNIQGTGNGIVAGELSELPIAAPGYFSIFNRRDTNSYLNHTLYIDSGQAPRGETVWVEHRSADDAAISIHPASDLHLKFYSSETSGFSAVGSIYRAQLGNIVYATTSDYRLKENIEDARIQFTDKIKKVQVREFNFRSVKSDLRTIGLVAHELKEVLPNLVKGEKDEVEEDGTPKLQSIDYSGIIPYLIGSIQELSNKIEQLESVK